MLHLLTAFLLCGLIQSEANAQLPPVKTAASVDLKKYLGTWYEIAAIPQYFEKQCVGNTTAEYASTDSDQISIVNSCDTAEAKRSIATGRAMVVDKISNSKLKVTFMNFFGWLFLLGGDYWILSVDENYSYAVVGAPDRDYAWILSRTPELSDEQIIKTKQILVDQGYDACKLITTLQTSGLQEKIPFCQLLSDSSVSEIK